MDVPGLNLDVSRETEGRLRSYADMVLRWNAHINIVGPEDASNLWKRHIRDSVGLARLIRSKTRSYVDLGSGGGFPGVVCAIYHPWLKTQLVESDRRKSAFLRAVRRELGLDFAVIEARIENISPLKADLLSARALAPLNILMGYLERHGAADGRALFMKGRNWRSEIDRANREWDFRKTAHCSYTDRESVILEIEQLTRRPHGG